MRRIGILVPATRSGFETRIEAFRAGLREFGYAEGKNVAMEYRSVENEYQRLPELARELARLRVDVIVTAGTPGTLAAKRASVTIPIVMAAISDPVDTGVVQSLARPEGNVTGMMFFVRELNAKRLEILREALPRLGRVAVLMHPDNVSMAPIEQAMLAAGKSLGLQLRRFDARRPEEFEAIFTEMREWRAEALVIVEDSMLNVNAAKLGALASARRLPAIGLDAVAQGGGLMAYGVNQLEMWSRAAYYVDRILRGAKPADLPIERSSKFELVVNMKTANALGVTLPQSLRVRADRAIE